MKIRWITPMLGSAAANEVSGRKDFIIIDVRDLVDKEGNSRQIVKEKILYGAKCLKEGKKIVVCCDYGISRSNAIAAGIIASYEGISFDSAVRLVQEATSEQEMKLGPLDAVRSALKESGYKKDIKNKRTILITGSTGFIGTSTRKRLEEEYTVIAPSREDLDLERGNTKLSLLASEHDVDCIVHLANPRVYTSTVALGKTLAMLRNVLEVCVLHDAFLIYPSSWELYSGYSGTLIADEALPAFPRGPYGETKYLAELLIEHWLSTTKLRCSLLRSSPVYGLGSDKPKFIYNFIDKCKHSEPIVTHQYSNGLPALDLLHIDDFVDVTLRISRQQYSGAFNIGTGILNSTRDIAEMIKAETASGISIEQLKIDTTTACISMDYQKAQRVLGWEPKITLKTGLQHILEKAL